MSQLNQVYLAALCVRDGEHEYTQPFYLAAPDLDTAQAMARQHALEWLPGAYWDEETQSFASTQDYRLWRLTIVEELVVIQATGPDGQLGLFMVLPLPSDVNAWSSQAELFKSLFQPAPQGKATTGFIEIGQYDGQSYQLERYCDLLLGPDRRVYALVAESPVELPEREDEG
jgi:hypothetical protein